LRQITVENFSGNKSSEDNPKNVFCLEARGNVLLRKMALTKTNITEDTCVPSRKMILLQQETRGISAKQVFY
jgi:hypothetical protein